jgi:hypothetical protein
LVLKRGVWVQTADVLKEASEAQRTIEQLKLQKEQAIKQVPAPPCLSLPLFCMACMLQFTSFHFFIKPVLQHACHDVRHFAAG